jgi:hypothetical protein
VVYDPGMPHPEDWTLELASLITTFATEEGAVGRTGGKAVPMAIEMGEYEQEVSDVAGDVDSGSHKEIWYEARLYPVNNDHTLLYCVPMEELPKLKIMLVNAEWNCTGFEGIYDGHHVAVELLCVRPNDAVEHPYAVFLNGKPYVEPPAQPMGPDFGDTLDVVDEALGDD